MDKRKSIVGDIKLKAKEIEDMKIEFAQEMVQEMNNILDQLDMLGIKLYNYEDPSFNIKKIKVDHGYIGEGDMFVFYEEGED